MDLDRMHAELVRRLDTTEAVRTAFADHPRHRYVPDLVWPDPQGLPLLRGTNPERWAAYVYDDDSVVTQANDGGSGPINVPSSSSSAPQLMADMIEAAGIEPGMRVLEIGTGTGWNARVLDSLVGPTGHITSVEIDSSVAEHARERLVGSRVEVVHGTEIPGTTVYDVVLATCAVTKIPSAWIERVEVGASIVVPWGPCSGSHASPVVALRKTGPKSAFGSFVCEAFFMRDRTQRVPAGRFPGMGRDSEDTQVVPFIPADLLEDDRLTRTMFMLPGVRIGVGGRPFSGGHGLIVYMGVSDSSWACLWPDGTTHSGGPTPLVDRLRETHELLSKKGWPELTEFSLEVGLSDDACRISTEFGSWEHPW